MNILEMIRENGMTLVDGNQGTKLLTSKEIVLNSIDREIKLIENRQHLNLLKVKSGNKQVDEKRMFIRDNEDSNNIKITIRVNGKILLREMINKKNNVSDLELSLKDARKVFEANYLKQQLIRFKGNIARTSSFVGMDRSALHRKIKELDININKLN